MKEGASKTFLLAVKMRKKSEVESRAAVVANCFRHHKPTSYYVLRVKSVFVCGIFGTKSMSMMC